MYLKHSNKFASISYCCICFHPSQCVLINKSFIQILLNISGVVHNPIPATIRLMQELHLFKRSVAKDTFKCNAKRNKQD